MAVGRQRQRRQFRLHVGASWPAPRPAWCSGRSPRPSSTSTPGSGFHSNDARGATITVDPGRPSAAARRACRCWCARKGAEIGVRTQAVQGLEASLALFLLDFDSELLFVGDAGTTEPSRPSRRIGIEWTNNYRPTPWASSTSTSPTPRRASPTIRSGGDHIPGAPAFIASAGVTLGGDDRLVRRVAPAQLRPAAADRRRQRLFLVHHAPSTPASATSSNRASSCTSTSSTS